MTPETTNPVKVSVVIITYNHAEYIGQALENAVNQVTGFRYEIVVGDDASTDGTRDILLDFQQKHPDKIRLLLHPENLGPAKYPGKFNFVETLYAATGEYVAFCDGDDFWCDDHKLQKQADLLDSHPDAAFCYHRVREIDDDGQTLLLSNEDDAPVSGFSDVLQGWSIRTASIMYRRPLIVPLPPATFHANAGDYIMQLWALQHGQKAYFMNEVMAVYRRHDRGVTRLITEDYHNYLRNNIILYRKMRDTFDKRHHGAFHEKLQHYRNQLYYELIHNIERKKPSTYLEMLRLAIRLKKLSPGLFGKAVRRAWGAR